MKAPTEREVTTVALIALAVAITLAFLLGHKSGYEQGSYEQWHEADTWAENHCKGATP